MSEVKLLPEGGKIRIEILLDRVSVEIYANNGAVPMTFFYLPEVKTNNYRLYAKEAMSY